ncbi:MULTISPECIES: antirestriction protein ArdA [Enterococcus]|uniref:Antirestriction protein ArdA n=1 Tax=Enterococcus gallinarum TaxID=1353 RepID=A0ABD4HIN8_ENTGA|nr:MULTISPECIES: antirestriction protein ArdA [Enterococcus]MBF0824108.1 antirestriction protein ArdA [Enterococcus faecalis]MBA0946664.1 antirestriction protein ArdA [Enterococcus gallinarum]MBA0959798.1 antirestriction protein ArdA [Enterococcus gallinarum]MBA0969532.1 antirestriction protein ArdA [Enterococcus gallinarum]MBA0971016.1 antirestriction protein ArdA [Enterococcus gallinarum]
MEQMRVYIANLGKYNEGELVGAWFTPPVDFDEVKERIGLNDEYEEYAIHDYELPFEIDEYTPIEEINRLCGLAEKLEGTPIGEVASEIQHAFFNSFEEMVEHVDDIIYYPDCNDMSDVAYYLIDEIGDLSEVPIHLQNYIDYKAYGRDLEIGGNYLVTSRGVFEYLT